MARRLHKRAQRTRRARSGNEYKLLLSDSEPDHDKGYAFAGVADSELTQRALRPSRASRAADAFKRKLRHGNRPFSFEAQARSRSSSSSGKRGKTSQGAGLVSDTTACDSSPLLNPNPTALTLTEAAILTVLVTDASQIGTLLTSPVAWGLSGSCFSTASLLNATVRPLAPEQLQLTATFARVPVADSSVTAGSSGTDVHVTSDGEDSSDSAYSIGHHPSESSTGSGRQVIKRGGWQKEDDVNLIKWKRLGKSWPWIFGQFPDRTEGAIKSRWYVVLSPRQRF